MQKQFYSEKASESLLILRKIAKETNFVVIGEWAVHAYIGLQRSLDVDIALDYNALDYFSKYQIQKYSGININYVLIDSITVDLFIPEFTDKDLPFPVADILLNYVIIDGIKIVKREWLLILKLWSYFSSDETKINKDIIDVVSLLFYGNIDLRQVKKLITTYKLGRRRTVDVILEYLDKGVTLKEFIVEKNEMYLTFALEAKKKIKRVLNINLE